MNAQPRERFPLAGRIARQKNAADSAPIAKTRHNWFLYAFIFLLPLQNIQTGYFPNFGSGFNFLNIGFVLSVIGALRCHGQITRWSGIQTWIFLYIGYAFFSLLLGYNNVHSDTEQHFNILKDSLIAILITFVVQKSVTNWISIKYIILTTLLPMPYMLRVTRDQHNSVSSWHYSDNLRISGTFSLLQANEFSAFCVTMAILFLALLLAGKWSKWWRALLVTGIVCMVMCIIWAYSRTAYIAVIVGGLAVAILWRGRWKMIAPLVIAAIVLPAILPVSVVERFDSTTIEEGKRDESTEMRFEFWQIAWENFEAHPIFGSGYHTFHHPEINPFGMDTHNFFMRELTEKGLIGFIITIGLLLSIRRACWRVMRESPHDNLAYALGLGMVAAWIALIIGNCFGDRFTYYPMISYFWVYLGLTLKGYELMTADKEVGAVGSPTTQPQHRFAQPRKTDSG